MSDPDKGRFGDVDDQNALPVVGIGASAGGLEALTEMLSEVRRGATAAFVVIQHLAPDQKSILHELLQSKCEVPVTQIVQNESVAAGHIYVVPPGKLAEIEGGTLRLTEREHHDHVVRPIDHFFVSLAKNIGRNAYCVVLSGTGSDGSEGLRAIKSAGGFAIAQEAKGARFSGMPDAAVATGMVDFVLPAPEIVSRLMEIVHHRGNVASTEVRERLIAGIENALPQIFEILEGVTGHDFSDYKPGTVLRRIERRMTLMRVMDAQSFVRILESDEKESTLLAHDFLIGVTAFFRDPEAFDSLKARVVDPIVSKRPSKIRVWVPGCSTGEEAYSVAMLFHEAFEEHGARCSLQVFGTDIDNHALVSARNGLFSAASVSVLGEERIERFFLAENGHFRAIPSVRESCVFAPHNLVQDPPFSRVDLISCRNVMIYLSSQLQNRVIPRFHFSLKSGGYLFLGPSEGLASEEKLFKTIDKSNRIFQRNDDAATVYSSLSEVVPRASDSRRVARIGAPPVPDETPHFTTREVAAERAFLAHHAAPFAVISSTGEVLYLSQAMTHFARPMAGVPSNQIDNFLSPELRVPVRSALTAVQESGAEQKVAGVLVANEPDGSRMYDFTLSPIDMLDGEFLLVLTEVRPTDTEAIGEAIDLRETMDREILVGENARLRRQLTEVLREYETSGQELKSTNEELMSMNEELQSSNEELETSREELQSINEELETVNAELRENNRRLIRANSDLKNLFESTDVAVLFLDKNFVVRSFTPPTAKIYGVKDRDVGRPIFDLSSRIDYPNLRADAEKVDATLQPVEHEVSIEKTDETFLLRIKPYRTTDDRIDGYVVSFVDITNRKRSELALERSRRELAEQYAELENLYDTTPVGISLVDREMRYVRVNQMLADINGFTIEEHIGKRFDELLPELAEELDPIYEEVFESGRPSLQNPVETELPSAPGEKRYFLTDFYPIKVEGEVKAVGTCVTEVTEQRRLMAELAESESRMKRLFDNSPVFIAITEGPQHVYTYSNPPHDKVCGNRQLIGKSILEALPELEGQGIIERFDKVYETGERMVVTEFPALLNTEDGTAPKEAWFTQTLEPIFDANGKTTGVATFAYEITDIFQAKQAAESAEQQKTILLGELQHRVKNTLATIQAISRLLLPGAADAESYQERLASRLMAMARTHNLLFNSELVSTKLHKLIEAEAAPYENENSNRIQVTGANLELGPNEATSIGMALHEFMTNAAKYGSLSAPDGKVEIRAEIDQKTGERHIFWKEIGGPPVKSPGDAKGFGSVVIEEVLAANLDAEVNLDFREDGLQASIKLGSAPDGVPDA